MRELKILLTAGLLIVGCTPHKPLTKLPSREMVEIERLQRENQELMLQISQMDELRNNCSKVLWLYQQTIPKPAAAPAKEKHQ